MVLKSTSVVKRVQIPSHYNVMVHMPPVT